MESNKLEKVSIKLVKDAPLMSKTPITSALDAVKLVGEQLCQMDREVVCVININAAGQAINCNIVSIGAVDYAIMHPREIFKTAILSNAVKMIIIHSHPSGFLYPSKTDTQITDQMNKACEIMGIKLLDHIIVGGDNSRYFSFEQHKLMEYQKVTYETDYNKLDISDVSVAEKDVKKRIHRSR